MGKRTEINDAELLALLKSGDRDAFSQIYDRYWQLLYISACKVIRDEDEAKDVVQDVFLSLLKKGAELEVHGNLSGYLYTAIRYKIFDHISKQKVRTDYADSFTRFSEQYVNNTDRTLLEKETRAEIEKEIQNLPQKMKIVFEMSRKEELSYQEIATTLNISDKTVKKQISNAIKLLKPKFTNYYSLLLLLFAAVFQAISKLF